MRGESLRLSVALARELPTEMAQQMLLDRLCLGESTSGCRYLYERLSPPFDTRHIEAIRKGLNGLSAQAAKAAAELAGKFPLDDVLASEWRIFFDQWKTKEKPYPKNGGAVPDSPRDDLAKILVQAFAHDHAFLLELLVDDRSDVRDVALVAVLTAATTSPALRNSLLEDVKNGRLKPMILRTAISKGLYVGEEAMLLVSLLYSSALGVRYAALPILDVKFLPQNLVQIEATRLLTDVALDIGEGASRALRSLTLREAEE